MVDPVEDAQGVGAVSGSDDAWRHDEQQQREAEYAHERHLADE